MDRVVSRDQKLTLLAIALGTVLTDKQQWAALCGSVGIGTDEINWDKAMRHVAYYILREADQAGKLNVILADVRTKLERAQAALKAFDA